MVFASAIWLFQESSSSGGAVIAWLVVVVLIVALIVWAVVVHERRNVETLAFLEKQGFTFRGDTLPATLAPPANVWLPNRTIRNCWTGMRNDFEVAIFRLDTPEGEGVLVRTMVAVRRSPIYDVRLNDFITRTLNPTVDTTSTPGWVIVAIRGNSRRPPILEALLKALTAGEEDAT
jgi:hypothetical protein